MINTADTSSLWFYTVGRRFPVVLMLAVVVFLNGLGLLVLFSVGRAHETTLGGFFFKQCIWLVFALFAFTLAVKLNYQALREYRYFILGLLILILGLVLIPGIGVKVNGARRWINLGLMNMQVSDFAKPLFILLIADYFSRHQRSLQDPVKGFIIPVCGIGLAFGFIILQPDFGTAFLFGLVGGVLVFLAGVSLKFLIPTACSGLAFFAVAIWQDPVRLQRILSFLDVEGNRSGGAYQLWQGLIGFGSGGVNGVGLGNGQQQFAFLPEAHTDFIFPIIGEELGFICSLAVVLSFALLFGVGWHQLRKAPGLFPCLLVAGALFFILFQALINMGVATGCLPTKGMSLPFVSYGGSNLVSTYFLLGIVVRGIWSWNDPPEFKPSEISS